MLEKFGSIILIAVAALALMGSAPALAEQDSGSIVVTRAWSRATPKGAKVAAGYVTIENHGSRPDRLLAASSAAAAKVEIHQMTTQDVVMMMRPVDGGLLIPPDQTVTLAPGGDHIMFIGLTAPFEEGQRIPVSLNFERSGKIDVTFEVGPVGATSPRLQIASPPRAAAATKTPSIDEPFFTHICGTRVMADVTITPGRRGPGPPAFRPRARVRTLRRGPAGRPGVPHSWKTWTLRGVRQ